MGNCKRREEKKLKELANSVEEFTYSLLEPLKADQELQEQFGNALDDILDDAIQLKQKKVYLNIATDRALTQPR